MAHRPLVVAFMLLATLHGASSSEARSEARFNREAAGAVVSELNSLLDVAFVPVDFSKFAVETGLLDVAQPNKVGAAAAAAAGRRRRRRSCCCYCCG